MASPSSLLAPYLLGEVAQPQTGGSSMKQSSICHEDNLQECTAYLSLELEALGMECVISDGHLDTPKLVNSVHQLLQLHRSTVSHTEDLTTTLHRMKSDLVLQHESEARFAADLEQAQADLISTQEKVRQLSLKSNTLSTKLRGEQEEVKRLQLCMENKKQQFQHTLKRKDKEYERLKDRLGQLVTGRGHDKKLGISLLNKLQQGGGGAIKGGGDAPGSNEVYQLMVSTFEERHSELMMENSSLREALGNMENELVALLNRHEGMVEGKNDGAHTSLSSGYLQMPFSIVRENIEGHLRDKYQRLSDYIHTLEQDQGLPQPQYDAKMEELEHKLHDYRKIIEQQEELLKQTLERGDNEHWGQHLGLLSESRLVQQKELVELQEELMKEKGKDVEDMQHKLLEAARQLDREREEFESAKAQFFRDQLLNGSMFVSPSKSNEMDSFYSKLCSTPYSSAKSRGGKSGKAGLTRSSGHETSIDLQNSISLCSDDGMEVLNDRQD